MLPSSLFPPPASPLSVNLQNYGLTKLAPSLIEKINSLGHKIVSVQSVSDKMFSISTKCRAAARSPRDPERQNVRLEVTPFGLRLMAANFGEHQGGEFRDQSGTFTEEQYTEKSLVELNAAALEAQTLFVKVLEDRDIEDQSDTVSDAGNKVPVAQKLNDEMLLLVKMIKF